MIEVPFWARKAARDPPAGPAPTMKMSVSTTALILQLRLDVCFESELPCEEAKN
jgi:hypothetical protein